MRNKPKPGTRVRLTGEFLRSTGQYAGAEGRTLFVVADCGCGLCATGPFVAVNSRSAWWQGGAERHLHYGNLEAAPAGWRGA